MSELPAIGDVVYRLSINTDKHGVEKPVGITTERFTLSLLGQFGKTVFSTREEAKAAMKKKSPAMPRTEGVQTDCFAYSDLNPSGKPDCAALKQLYCKTEHCNFYKRRETA